MAPAGDPDRQDRAPAQCRGSVLSVTALPRLTDLQGGAPVACGLCYAAGMQVGTNILGTAEKVVPTHL
jgi:hypothetical protein